ncbi:arylsulfotransferase family protein [Nocardia sp. NPDC046473]|uniref:arylsulfotransferase family protein n=1 Tax=Nocardia sp. NPDC046473 TaxID=3155733 RepID=UPI0033C5E697
MISSGLPSIRAAVLLAAVSALAAVSLPATGSAVPYLPTLPIGSPSYTVNVNRPDGAARYIFYTAGVSAAALIPAVGAALSGLPGGAPANVIADRSGREIWRYTPPAGQGVANFRTQTYRGKPVLTWWQGGTVGGHGSGVDYVADDHYQIIATVTPGAGLSSDVHEFRLTPDNHALITSYQEVPADLTAIGGPRNGMMFDCIAAVVDVATNEVLFRWSAAQHIPLTDTQFPGLIPGNTSYDPYHMNSIALDPSGNLVISMRNTSAVYDIDTHTGAVNWQLGGKGSTLDLGPGVQFAFQHDAEFSDPATLRLFNDNSSGPTTLGPSSVQWIHLDLEARRATLIRNQTHPDGLVTVAMGNAQDLPNGNTLVGWGVVPRISEFSPTGELVYDVTLPFGTYRAYSDSWTPAP